MIDERRRKEAKKNFDIYLTGGMIKKIRKEENEITWEMYLKNAELSLKVAEELSKSHLKPHIWVIVTSYYSMFYIANAVLMSLGYKTQGRNVHQVTSDALVVLVLDKLKKELLEGYESAKEEALELAAAKAEDTIRSYDFEREKRNVFQYNMLEHIEEGKASTSLRRAREFMFEMRKLMN